MVCNAFACGSRSFHIDQNVSSAAGGLAVNAKSPDTIVATESAYRDAGENIFLSQFGSGCRLREQSTNHRKAVILATPSLANVRNITTVLKIHTMVAL